MLKHKVSLKNMLSHTTGYRFSGNRSIESGLSRSEILKKLAEQSPESAPSKCFFYSNMVYSLVEEILNQKKLSLVQALEKLRTLLKTDEIQVLPFASEMAVAYPHIKRNKQAQGFQMLPLPPYYPKAAPASAGIFASLDGMIALFKVQFGYRPDLLSQKLASQLHKPVIIARLANGVEKTLPLAMQGMKAYYGLGWRLLKSEKNPKKDLIFHGGSLSGISTFIGFMPSEEIGIIVLMNQESAAWKTGLSFFDVWLK